MLRDILDFYPILLKSIGKPYTTKEYRLILNPLVVRDYFSQICF